MGNFVYIDEQSDDVKGEMDSSLNEVYSLVSGGNTVKALSLIHI